MDSVIRRGRGAAALCVLLAGPGAAGAAVRSETAVLPTCAGGGARDCVATSVLGDAPADADSPFLGAPRIDGAPATFATAFAAWNAAHGDAWSLVDGGALPLTISAEVGLDARDATGGLSPVLFTVAAADPSLLGRLVWTQALDVNYAPLRGPLAAPVQTLDTFDLSQDPAGDNPNFPKSCAAAAAGASPAGGAFCGPIYPFQYGATLMKASLDGVPLGVDPFYDAPRGPWPDASFEAVTLLSSVTAPDTLTVYQGVAYGFALSADGAGPSSSTLADPVPEPPTWTLALLGFAALARRAFRPRRAPLNAAT